jgi:lipopolysaccharide export LptBFGC system permease protein LptF
VVAGGINPMVGMWAVHVVMVLLLALLLYRRMFGFRFQFLRGG